MEINELIVKVSSICNLSCKYCYVFNKDDDSHKYESNLMSIITAEKLLQRIEEYGQEHKQDFFLIVFHGGEPLMLEQDFFKSFVTKANDIVKSMPLSFIIQTNGTLLTDEWYDLFNELKIQVGISLDGDKLSSKNRIFKNGEEAFDKIMQGYDILRKNDEVNILSVCNTSIQAQQFYDYFKSIRVNSLDCLLPDANYVRKQDKAENVGKWLIDLFDCWYFDESENKIHIRLFATIIAIILGNDYRGNEVIGRQSNAVFDIKTNGQIELVDTLRICGSNVVQTGFNIESNKLTDIFANESFYKYYNAHQDDVLCEKCQKCVIKEICGGGMLAHRYSKEKGFDNPSIYCEDMYELIAHIQNTLIDDLPQEFIAKMNLTKL